MRRAAHEVGTLSIRPQWMQLVSAVATPCEGIVPFDIVIAHVAFATASNDAFPETWTLRACQCTRRLRVYGTPKYYILLDY